MSRVLTGQVRSTKMAKTAVVTVMRQKVHPLYKKAIRWTKQFHARDEIGAKEGDTVKIVETRPLSASIRWKVIEIIKK